MVIDPNCQICRHSQRIQIDLSVQTIGQRETARQFRVSRQAIQRHLEKGHSDTSAKPPAGKKVAPVVIPPRERVENPEPLAESALAYDGIAEAPAVERSGLVAPKRKEALKSPQKQRKKGKMPPARHVMERREPNQAERAVATIRDYKSRKAYVGKLLRTGTFNGMPTLERLRGCWPDLTMLQLAEITAQAAMEADFLRGTRQARRLVVLAKADKIYREALDKKDLRMALKALEFATKVDGVSAEPDLVASLASSQAWAITARVLQAKFPEAFEAIHGELVAEESRKRQALAPMTVESNQDG